MSFNKVILKNLKSNMRYYFAYFLCIVCSISFFFMLTNLIADYNLKTAFGQADIFPFIVGIPLFVLGLFSIIFISYVNRTLVNQMGKELGLFLALGMDKKKISKIILVQNITIGLVATGIGLILGSIFSRLFFIVILKIMDISNVPFGLHLKSYIFTTLMFFIIYIYLLVRSLFMAKKIGAIDLMKKDRSKEEVRFKKPVWGIVGIILIALAIIIYYKYNNCESDSVRRGVTLGYTLISLIGVSLMLSQSHNLLAFISKRNKDAWYRNLIFNTNFRYRISSNKKFILALVMTYCIMFDFGVVLYHEYARIETLTKELNNYDFQYLDVRDNKIDEETLNEVIKKQGVSVKDNKNLEVVEVAGDKGPVLLMNDKNFNDVFNKNLQVNNGKAVLLKRAALKQAMDEDIKVRGVKESNEDFKKYVLGKEYGFKVIKDDGIECVGNHDYRFIINNMYYVVSKDDFDKIAKEEGSKSLGKIYYYNFNNWKDGYKVEKSLGELENNYFNTEVNGRGVLKISKAFSTWGKIKVDRSQHGLILFLFAFVCAIFFMAAGSLIYFKYFSEINNDKKRYKKLMGIGVTHKEIKNMIGKEMIFMFFVPLIMGYAISAIKLFGNYVGEQKKVFLVSQTKVILMCIAIQIVYYLISRRKVYNEVIGYIKN